MVDEHDFVPDFGSDDDPFNGLDDELQSILEGDFDWNQASQQAKIPPEFDADPAHVSILYDEPPTRPSIPLSELPPPPSESVWIETTTRLQKPELIIPSEPPPSEVRRDRRGRAGLAVAFGLLCCIGLLAAGIVLAANQMLPPEVAALIPRATPTVTVTSLFMPPVQSSPTTQPTEPPAVNPSATPASELVTTEAVGPASTAESPASPSAQPTNLPSPAVTPSPTATESNGNQITQSGIPMVYVPGGTFEMGSTERAGESPIHEVTLSPYYIDQYEVSNASWAACVDAGACQPPGDTRAYDGTPYYGVEDFDTYPVVYVSWYNADAYCQWRGARLPTEAEWEMAARWDPATGESTVYPWGDAWDPSRLNYCDSSCLLQNAPFIDPSFDDGWPQMSQNGFFASGISPVGAYDMAGNVAEWIADWYSADYYATSPAENPLGPETGESRVVRGGGWSLDRNWNRSAARSHFSALAQVAGIGFRCVLSADEINP